MRSLTLSAVLPAGMRALRFEPLRTLVLAAAALLLLPLACGAQGSAEAAADAELLLEFKASFVNGDSVLASWQNGSDPCGGQWVGVNCSGGAAAGVTDM